MDVSFHTIESIKASGDVIVIVKCLKLVVCAKNCAKCVNMYYLISSSIDRCHHDHHCADEDS